MYRSAAGGPRGGSGVACRWANRQPGRGEAEPSWPKCIQLGPNASMSRRYACMVPCVLVWAMSHGPCP